jgi:hypothetical protein
MPLALGEIKGGGVGMRTRLAISVVVLLGVGFGAAVPAGASSVQTKYINALHHAAPSTKAFSNKKMLGLGKVLCKALGFATVADDVGELDDPSNAYHFPKKQVVPIVATSVTYFCPSHTKAVLAFEAHPSGVPTPTTVPARTVKGTATTLGSGNFTGGTDVAPGLYDVTAGAGQSGNFIVQGTDSYDEVLGGDVSIGDVPEVRAQISAGDQIQISSLSQVIFTPVSTPYVTTQTPVTLYAGTWTVGQDLGPGRYVATPGTGQSGNFIIANENVDEILGGDPTSGDVPNVTFTVQNGDTIDISSLSQVMLNPS